MFSSTAGSARSSVVTGSLRLRSMRTLTRPFLSISSSSQEPRDGIRLAVKTCLVDVLRLHDVGARGAHQLRHDHALGAVDDEGALVGHPREVAQEHGLLADLARVQVGERHLDVDGHLVGQVLLAALPLGDDRIADRVFEPSRNLQPLGVVRIGEMSSIVSRRPDDLQRVGDHWGSPMNHRNDAFWMSIRLGTSRTFSSLENVLRILGASCFRQSKASRGALRGSEASGPDQRRNPEQYQGDRFLANRLQQAHRALGVQITRAAVSATRHYTGMWLWVKSGGLRWAPARCSAALPKRKSPRRSPAHRRPRTPPAWTPVRPARRRRPRPWWW